jgi:phosphoenolpyruvate carboxykinase (GTP)
VPTTTALNVEGLNVTEADMAELLTVHNDEWRDEVPRIREHFATFGDDLPSSLNDEIDRLEANLA